MDPYQELGLPSTATDAEIRAAHRRRTKETHPDKGGSREAFERVTRAVVILRDPAARAKYDATGEIPDDKATKSADADAIAVLVSTFQRTFMQVDVLEITDVIDRTKHALRGATAELGVQRRHTHAAHKRTTTAITRLAKTTEGANPLSHMLNEQLRVINAALASIDEQEKSLIRALELANGYQWTVDAPIPAPPASAYQGFGSGRTSGHYSGAFRLDP